MLLFVFGGGVFVHAQNLPALTLDNSLSVLNGKAYFSFPDSARNYTRSANIMAADHNENKETRIVYDYRKMRIVFFAQELFLLGDKNLFEYVKNDQSSLYKFNRAILTDRDSLFSILSIPTVFHKDREAILISTLLVKMQNNSVFRMDAYINKEAYPNKSHFEELSVRVFRTLSKGSRTDNLRPKTIKLPIYGTKKSFAFKLPENFTITVDQKYDFQVFNFHEFKEYHDSDWVSLTLYTGHHPSSLYPEYGLPVSHSKISTGSFLNADVDWLFFDVSSREFYLKEQQIPSDKIGRNLIVHIAMASNRKELIDELTGIVESIRLVQD